MPTFHRTAGSYRQGARTLPREYYTSNEVFAREIETIHARQWCCVGRESAVAEPGSFILRSVAGESIIIVRDREGVLRAFFNVCRHRGTRICRDASGRFSGSIQCPYHAWTYGLDGRLIGAPHMQEVADFDRSEYPLHPAALARWEGFLFINVAREPEPFERAFAPMLHRLERFGIGSLEVGHSARYEVAGNWKLVFQNYSECLHCPMIHPELSAVLPYQSGANDLTDGRFLGGYMEIAPPNSSATMSGQACGVPLSTALSGADLRRAFYYSLMPNMLLSVHPDYVNYYIVTPVTADTTLVESEWLFSTENHGSAAFNPGDAIEFWDRTNRQDWDIVAASQLGISSRVYVPGPYSPRESIPAAWDAAYMQAMRA